MREIKFRAFDKKNNRMDYEITYGGNISKNMNDAPGIGDGEDLSELMQYTGLRDKNGKEIYEWDILKVDERETSIGQVIFDIAEFKLKMVCFDDVLWKLAHKTKTKKRNPEVIGNIYENSELLTDSTPKQ